MSDRSVTIDIFRETYPASRLEFREYCGDKVLGYGLIATDEWTAYRTPLGVICQGLKAIERAHHE